MTERMPPTDVLGTRTIRAFSVDFNRPLDNLLASVYWWAAAPDVGEEVLLFDSDLDFTLGRVKSIHTAPDKENRKRGLIVIESECMPWIDGNEALSLILEYLRQPTRGVLLRMADLG